MPRKRPPRPLDLISSFRASSLALAAFASGAAGVDIFVGTPWAVPRSFRAPSWLATLEQPGRYLRTAQVSEALSPGLQ